MQHSYTLFYSILIGIVCLSSACSPTNSLTIPIINPAPVYVPNQIQRIGIINRSESSDTNSTADAIEKILSFEGKNMDQEGAQTAIKGLLGNLQGRNRFEVIKVLDQANIKSPGLGIYPSLLSWEQVHQICEEQQVDALFVLSFYDTDARADYKAVPVTIQGPLGVEVPALEQHVRIVTLVKIGWRIYDPINQVIRDEFIMNNSITSEGSGLNPMKAVQAVMGRKDAVLRLSNDLGVIYGDRIFPFRTRVRRKYFVRGSNNFRVAMRRARLGNWNGAAELWEQEVNNPKGRIAGRACYNMAIINEINGNLPEAIEWGSRAYGDYANRDALRYVRILQERQRVEAQLARELSD